MPRRRTLIQVPPDLVVEIDALVGPRKRSAFVVELARREIRRQKLLKVFENKEPIWREEDHPEFAGDSDAWVRTLRAEAESRFERLGQGQRSPTLARLRPSGATALRLICGLDVAPRPSAHRSGRTRSRPEKPRSDPWA